MLQGNFIVNSVKGKIISEHGYYEEKPLIEQSISLASYRDNLVDIIAKLQNRVNITKSRIEDQKTERLNSTLEFVSNFSNGDILFTVSPPILTTFEF